MPESVRAQRGRRASMIMIVVLAMITTVGATMIGSASRASAAEPIIDEEVLFTRGEAGYFCFRIPTIVKATNGDLLAIVEGRVDSCADQADIDLVLKRSTDDGRTWGPVEMVADGGGNTYGNPMPVVDERTGRITLFANTNDHGCLECNRSRYVQVSDDHGHTWTDPVETPHLLLPEWDQATWNGPVHGIQLTRGEHAGRLVISAGHRRSDGDNPLPIYGAHLLYSDDGVTWQIGAVYEHPEALIKPSETTIVELTDGRIYLNAREIASASDGYRAWATSSDGGETFDLPFHMQPEMSTTMVQASLLRLTAVDEGDPRNRILFSTPAHPGAREVASIRSSFDEARTWETWEEGKVFWWGPTAYSDMVDIGNEPGVGNVIGYVYEAGVANPYETIRWARFNESYLDTPNGTPGAFPPPPEPGPTTPDAAPRTSNTVYVRGDAALADGRFGSGLRLDGEGDFGYVPFNDSLDLADGDFTLMSWFRYDATSGDHPILWAYRINAAPQVWLRAEPGSNRLRAHMGTGQGSATIASRSAYNDGAWHHVVVQRVAGRFVMSVDGVEVAAAAAPIGSVTNGRELGVDGWYIGSRLDRATTFAGTLDEVRIYTRALDADELRVIRERNVDINGQQRLEVRFGAITP